ncbi:MAG: hypothetical protein ACFB9M_18850 [Myxococcota bacterium]
MNRKCWMSLGLAWVGVMGSGCENPDSGFVFNRFMAIDDECEFDPTSNPTLLALTFDPSFTGSVRLFADIQNNLVAPDVIVDEESGEVLSTPRDILVEEFAVQFQCDSSVFSGLTNPFFLLDTLVPFCFDTRDTDADAIGFDVVPVAANVQSNTQSTVTTPVITPFLGAQVNTVFAFATQASACCDVAGAPPGCTDLTNTGSLGSSPNPACMDLAMGLESGLVEPFQIPGLLELARFTRAFATPPDIGSQGAPASLNQPLLLTVFGNYRGVTTSGNTVVSNDAVFQLGICRGCLNGSEERARLDGDDELADALVSNASCFSLP